MRVLRYLLGSVLLLLVAATAGIYLLFRSSLPVLDGSISAAQLTGAATIKRDAAGVPTLQAATRRDLALATGFVHAQDRFFQMDLMRRVAAGELAELLGAAVVDVDKRQRIHDFRNVAAQVLKEATDEDRSLLEAYSAGVNLGLARLGSRPWEYWLLRSEPRPWQPSDCILIAFAMYLDLNDANAGAELQRGRLRDSLPEQLLAFLYPSGTQWDAPLVGDAAQPAPIPGPDVLDLRQHTSLHSEAPSTTTVPERPLGGSNSWVVAGAQTTDGRALLANDMHLGLRLPHIWYRARLIVTSPSTPRQLVGVTLPGLPVLIAGSNGKVAWGYTNTLGDWSDLVVVTPDAAHEGRYLTADGSEPFGVRHEIINVRGAPPVSLDIETTRWGPLIRREGEKQLTALAWTAHHSVATNLRMLDFERATSVSELLDIANRTGGPVQNVVAADTNGHIGWTLMGKLPVRTGYDSRIPGSWQAPGTGWTGWREPQEYPRLIDPPSGRLWTANNRTLELERWRSLVGGDSYDLGARAAQIRDDLSALHGATAADMLKIQLDDRALFLARWRDLLLETLDPPSLGGHAERVRARDLVEAWSARAATDDRAYPIVKAFHDEVRRALFERLIAPARSKYPKGVFYPPSQFEGAVWQLVTERPAHMLDARYASWREFLLASLDAALSGLQKQCGTSDPCSWGKLNALQMRHPLSRALPFASSWLDMPLQALPGDSNMPRVQNPSFGASERLVVSPGHEDSGYLEVPGSQVDHPLSPFYRMGHEAWVRGEPTPLLPGETRHALSLIPVN